MAKFSHAEKILLKEKTGHHKKKLIQLMTIIEAKIKYN